MYYDIGPGDLVAFDSGNGGVGVCIRVEKKTDNKELITFAHPDGEVAFFDSNTVQHMLDRGIWVVIERFR